MHGHEHELLPPLKAWLRRNSQPARFGTLWPGWVAVRLSAAGVHNWDEVFETSYRNGDGAVPIVALDGGPGRIHGSGGWTFVPAHSLGRIDPAYLDAVRRCPSEDELGFTPDPGSARPTMSPMLYPGQCPSLADFDPKKHVRPAFRHLFETERARPRLRTDDEMMQAIKAGVLEKFREAAKRDEM